MNWKIQGSKIGENTLVLNDIFIYSKYRPNEDAKKWIISEVNEDVDSYVLIGLGLGYHLKALFEMNLKKKIFVVYFEKEEYDLFLQENKTMWWKRDDIIISQQIDEVYFENRYQILLPSVWLKALGNNHILYPLLETIKVNVNSYKKFAPLMIENFKQNSNQYTSLTKKKIGKIACLVAAGPSLNETMYWLKDIKGQVDIYAVGSALKPLLNFGIEPDAVIISDPKHSIDVQLKDSGYNGLLYYLSTASYKAVIEYKNYKEMIFQKDFYLSERLAQENQYPLLETGGSVSTLTFSLIKYLGYNKIILFGLDLGYPSNQSHVSHSSSSSNLHNLVEEYVMSNSGEMVKTQANLLVYLRWFNEKIQESHLTIYNTSYNGAKITGALFINKIDLDKILSSQ